MGAILVILLCILASVIVYAVKTSEHENELLRNKDAAASSTNNNEMQTTDNETQTADNAPNDGSTPTQPQPTPQGAPLTREELDRLLFKYHDKLFGTIVKAILMAMLIWSAIGGIVAAFIVAASVH